MRIHILGSSEAVPHAKRKNTCLYFEDGPNHLLVDGHALVSVSLSAKKIDYTQIEHVFLTHKHMDHVLGFLNLLEHIYLTTHYKSPVDMRKGKPINIYGNADVLGRAKELMRIFGHLDGGSVTFPRIFHELPMQAHDFTIGKMKIYSFPTNHGDTHVLGLAVQVQDDRKVVYSVDTIPHQPIYDLLQENDILIHECNNLEKPEVPVHTTLPQLKNLLPSIKAKHVYLVHLPEMDDAKEADLHAQLDASCHGRMSFCHDGQTITF